MQNFRRSLTVVLAVLAALSVLTAPGLAAPERGLDGQRVRFWETPDQPGPARAALWQELLRADVDHINTDDLPGLRDFLLADK